MKNFKIFPLCIAAAFSFSQAVLDLPNAQPKVDAAYWKTALDSTWQGLIRRNIAPYNEGKGLIHRPKSETPGDAVSEGVGYGMLVALYANDQDQFNSIWEAANENMWDGYYHNWQLGPDGKIAGMGAATDAEEDIALSLIFADKLVSAGKWEAFNLSGTDICQRLFEWVKMFFIQSLFNFIGCHEAIDYILLNVDFHLIAMTDLRIGFIKRGDGQ